MPRAGGDDGGAGVREVLGRATHPASAEPGVKWAVGSEGQVERGLERS